MKKIRQFRKLKKQWKIAIAVAFVAIIFSGVGIFVNADSSVGVSVTKSTSVQMGKTTNAIICSLTGTDDNHYEGENMEENYKPNPAWLSWSITDDGFNIAKFVNQGIGDTYLQSVSGTLNPVVYGYHAGIAVVTAEYQSRKYYEGTTVYEDPVTATCKVTVPISVEMTATRNGQSIDTGAAYKMGDLITFTANTCETNKIFVETNNDKTGNVTSDGVVELVPGLSNATTAVLKIVGGGATTVTVRTEDGDGVPLLSSTFTIRGEVNFLEGTDNANAQGHYITHLQSDATNKYMVLSDTDYEEFSYEIVPSNVISPSTAGIVFKSDSTDIATVVPGSVCGVKAGIAQITMGLTAVDTGGNEVWLSRDTVNIIVPFKKLGNNISNLNVGDQLQLQTSADANEITWTSSDTSILQVDENGLITAVGSGSAKIYASRVQDELYSVYNMPYQLVYDINVIDGFGLSSMSTTVNIGDTVDINALVTNNPTKDQITYTVTNQPDAAGVVPTGDLVTVVQSDDGKTFTVTGVASGTVHLKVSQNINGVIKSATCVIYVTTPVNEVSINPSSIQINRGDTGTVQLLFNPSGPTNNKVMWSSSNTSVATVTGDSYTATITGVKGGSATITVITEDGLKVATCDVYVREPVTGVTLNATTVESTMAIGQYQLTPTITPSGDGVNRNCTWSSSNESVCKVDSNGLVKYVAPGYCTIICQTVDGAYIATCNFVISIPVTTIKLDYTDEIMSVGGKLRISAEVLPLTASNRTCSWESSNTNVCVVDSNGLVEAVGTGSCTILCKSLDGGATAMCNIYVKQPVTSVVLNTTDITVRKGQVFWLNATCLPENADNKLVSWESRDTAVCTVESDGKVTATGAGTTSIICTNTDTGLTAYCVVTVTQPVTGISLNSDYQELWVGAKYAIIPTIEPADAENKNVTYLSSDTSVATVDSYGVVTALKGGNCVIEVTTEECHLVAACTIVVKEYVSTIELSETDKFMNVGATGTLKATVGTSTATNKKIIWSSSDNSICSVDQDGNLNAISVGNVVITATAADGSGVSASCIIKVVNPVKKIEVDPSTAKILVGDSVKLSFNITPSDATVQDVVWTSSNEAIATVDEDGEVFGLSTGKVKITATSQDGNSVKGSCWVYVSPVVNISSLKINSSEIYMLVGKSRQLSCIVRPATNTDSFEWYSTDTGIVTVNESGVITTVGPGQAEVFVMSKTNSVQSSCIVHSLAISRSSISLEQYDSYTLDVIGTSDSVTWRSSNPRVCTVSTSGEVVARKAGVATVTAVVDNKTLSCVVSVYNFR